MKKIKKRNDLLSKYKYHIATGISRVTIDKKIAEGELSVEEISGIDYIILNSNSLKYMKYYI